MSTGSNQHWLDFCRHERPDNKGRMLEDLWMMTFDEIEKTHDFIQWLFPLPEASPINPEAPLLTQQLQIAVMQDKALQEQLLRSFDLMAAFWGFCRDEDNLITSSPQFTTQNVRWICEHNHNHLRITRVIKCLSLVGLNELSNATCQFLLSSINNAGLSLSSIPATQYWLNAISAEEEIELTLQDFNSAE